MIEIKNLSKHYGQFHAVQDISFTVSEGEILGFLGPNGAGKSTTMRILCGCIGATSGTVTVNGMDVKTNPIEVKSQIGYLPETPPVYPSMVVREYLEFCATIKGVDTPKMATDKVIELVGLQDVQSRIIQHLSKGFRQRVGLAQALIHDPSVLVLDEPTSGLDPKQRREIRELLKTLAQGKRTVILSTHVLGEIEAICERVVIISRGQVVCVDRLDAIYSEARRIRVELESPTPDIKDRLLAIPEVKEVQQVDDHLFTITSDTDVRTRIAQTTVDCGLLQLIPAEGLEDVYIRLTGAS